MRRQGSDLKPRSCRILSLVFPASIPQPSVPCLIDADYIPGRFNPLVRASMRSRIIAVDFS